MKLLVIGSEGFIGSHLLNHFHTRGDEVMGIDLKPSVYPRPYPTKQVLSVSYSLSGTIGSFIPDVCIFSGGSANVQLSIQQPKSDFESNVQAVSSLMDALLKINPSCKVLHISSAAVYGNPADLPVKEDSPLQPLSPYGWHKQMAETLCSEYFICFGLPTCSVRLFSVYGEGQQKLLFWDLYRKIKSNEPPLLFGTGNESRDFLHISDLVSAFETIIKKGVFNGGVYNIGSGVETRIKEAADIFFELAGNNKQPAAFNKVVRLGDPLRWQADIGRLSELGFSPKLDLTTGLKQYITWLRENA